MGGRSGRGLISTIQNKTEQARAKERIKPLLESRMMRDILLEVGQRGTEKLDPQSVPLEQRPRAAKLAAENGTAGLLQSGISELVAGLSGLGVLAAYYVVLYRFRNRIAKEIQFSTSKIEQDNGIEE